MRLFLLVSTLVVILFGCVPSIKKDQQANVWIVPEVVIDSLHPNCQDNRYGFEGGDLKKVGDTIHVVVNERFADLVTVYNRFGHWVSTDGKQWRRLSTLMQYGFDTTGVVPNSCIYSPRLAYNEKEAVWCLFYIQFLSSPARTDAWYVRYDGRVMLSKSQTKGKEGIGGPYDVGYEVFRRPDSASWVGLQGITAFSPYQVGSHWYALYSSANTEEKPCKKWSLGLAIADSLAGPWQPFGKDKIQLPIQAESPVVQRIGDVFYALVDEVSGNENFSLLKSDDGVNWNYIQSLVFMDRDKWEWNEVRSPIGFMQEDGYFTTHFTTYFKNTDFAPIRKMNFSINKE